MKEPHSVGTVVDRRYALKREIARGAAGVVYEAEHLYTKRRVAMKLLTLAHFHAQESRARLLREAEALALCRHPGVVQVLDAGEIDDLGPYVVTELLEGRTLQGILAVRQRVALYEALQVGRQLCDALGAAHARGIVHRDVKPSNVFVARDETGREVVKVFDFGIARMKTEDRKLTQHGAVIGTPEYMAPEQMLAQDNIDARADVYAVGVVLFECLTGSVPFEGNFGEVLLKRATRPLTPVRSRAPTVPAEIATAVEKALGAEPADRYPSISAFGEALSQIVVPDVGGSLLGLRPARPAFRPAAPKAAAPPALPVDQRRRSPRAPYVTPVTIQRDSGAALSGRSEDISVGGLLVVMAERCEADAVVIASFALPTTGTLVELEATTKWVRTARGVEAMGLQFTAVPPDVHAIIDLYVRSMGGG
jgi:serine/threonine-protein kinase